MYITEGVVFVNTYKRYNEGRVYTEPVSICDFEFKSEFIEYCKSIFPEEKDPELMFADYSGIPDCLITESSISEQCWNIINSISDGEVDKDALEAFLEIGDFDEKLDIIEQFSDRYYFSVNFNSFCSTEEQFGEYVIEEGLYTTNIPKELEQYIDYEKLGRDLLMTSYIDHDGYVFTRY